MSTSAVSLEVRDGVAVLSLRRPEARNALHAGMVADLRSAVARVAADRAVGCLLLRGDGPGFCSGGDVRLLSDRTPAEVIAYNRSVLELVEAIERSPVPSVAAIQGAALGGGLELALGCSIRVAAADARLGMPETAAGTIPAAGGLARLPRLIGHGAAARMVLAARPVDAVEALRIGLVDEVVAVDGLEAAALELARRIAAGAPLAVRAAWAALRDARCDAGLEAAVADGERRLARLAATSDFREGMTAFVERRAPRFAGR